MIPQPAVISKHILLVNSTRICKMVVSKISPKSKVESGLKKKKKIKVKSRNSKVENMWMMFRVETVSVSVINV